MAKLFPEIEVFTTAEERLWTHDSIKGMPLMFSKDMKVLELHGFAHDIRSRFRNNFNAVIEKLQADGVDRIGLVSLPCWGRVYGEEEIEAGFSEAEGIAKILSTVTVDHLMVYTNSLRAMYAICAQINDMYVQSPINVYFLNIRFFPSNTNADVLCLKLRRMGLRESEGFEIAGDDVDTCKMITVHLSGRKLYTHEFAASYRDFEIRLTETQGLSLNGFPCIEVNLDGNFDRIDVIKMCSDLGIASKHEWPSFGAKFLWSDKRDTKSVCFDSRRDQRFGHSRAEKVIDPNNMLSLSESLNKISPHAGPHPSVTVAVLDTGILACHQEFKDKIVAMKNFVPNEAIDLCYDANGHGTSCAGILVRTAPFVRLVVCKVVRRRGTGQLKWAADAIDWLLNDESGPKNYCPIDIISMSFGSNTFDSDLRGAVSEAITRGRIVIAAASNDRRKKLTNIAFPARFGDVICVGSCNNLGQPSSFSPTGREIDFLAPGEDIQGPSSGGFDLFQRLSGTSEATPAVAGIAAMVISYAETIGGQVMRSAVCHTAVMREILRKMASMPGHHDEHMGYGNLDPLRLFKYGPDHFRQVVEEIVGPLPVLQTARRDAETQTHELSC